MAAELKGCKKSTSVAVGIVAAQVIVAGMKKDTESQVGVELAAFDAVSCLEFPVVEEVVDPTVACRRHSVVAEPSTDLRWPLWVEH